MNVKELISILQELPEDLPVYMGEASYNRPYDRIHNPIGKVTHGKFYEGHIANLIATEEEQEDEMLMEELNSMPEAIFLIPC